jgi:hypothetical protein
MRFMKLIDIIKKELVDTITMLGALVFLLICTRVLITGKPIVTLDMSLYPFCILGWFIGSVGYNYFTQ